MILLIEEAPPCIRKNTRGPHQPPAGAKNIDSEPVNTDLRASPKNVVTVHFWHVFFAVLPVVVLGPRGRYCIQL